VGGSVEGGGVDGAAAAASELEIAPELWRLSRARAFKLGAVLSSQLEDLECASTSDEEDTSSHLE